uniref:Uncharacterized protein n=1 Tax=Setaria italica TaxID=4555 RepID=K3Y0S8_SETIT
MGIMVQLQKKSIRLTILITDKRNAKFLWTRTEYDPYKQAEDNVSIILCGNYISTDAK